MPSVQAKIAGNETFFFPDQPLEYVVDVSDREDGALATGQIPLQQVAIAIDYVREGFDVATLRRPDETVEPATRFAAARAVMEGSDCKTCHNARDEIERPALRGDRREISGRLRRG